MSETTGERKEEKRKARHLRICSRQAQKGKKKHPPLNAKTKEKTQILQQKRLFWQRTQESQKLKSRKNTKHRAQQTSQQNTTHNKLPRRRRRRRRPCNNNNNKVVAKKPPPEKQPKKRKKNETKQKKICTIWGRKTSSKLQEKYENPWRKFAAQRERVVRSRERASKGGRASRLCLVSLAT